MEAERLVNNWTIYDMSCVPGPSKWKSIQIFRICDMHSLMTRRYLTKVLSNEVSRDIQ